MLQLAVLRDRGSLMKLRSFFTILISGVVVLLVVGAIGFFWLFSKNPLTLLNGSGVEGPAAAIFVPRQAPAMISLLVNPDRLESFRAVVAQPGKRKQARAEFEDLKRSLLASSGLTYEQDVQPWLGDEMTLAITTRDIDRDAATGSQPGYLLALATKDPQRSREFLQLFWQKRAIAGKDLVFEQYKGVQLIYDSGAEKAGKQILEARSTQPDSPQALSQRLFPTPELASAVVGDRFVLFANHPKVLRDAINNVQVPDLNLSDARAYRKALDSLMQPRIGLTFINLPEFSEWIAAPTMPGERAKAAKVESAPVSPEVTAPETLAIGLSLQTQGLLAETVLQGEKIKPVRPTLDKPVAALQYLPAAVPLLAAGVHLDRLTTGLSEGTRQYGTLAQLLNQAQTDLQNRWKLDLQKDVFRWVTGEYAIGLLPSSGTAAPKTRKPANAAKGQPAAPVTGDWVFVAEKTAEAGDAIAHLDDLARQQGLSVGPLALGDQTVSTWTRLSAGSKARSRLALEAQVQGVHAAAGDYEVFATSLAAMDRALKAIEKPLSASDPFQQATRPLLHPNNGYLYLDWRTSRPILEQQFPLLSVLELAGKPLFDHLRSLTVSSYGSEFGSQHGGVFMQLQ